jgi:chaperonin GroEL (HSP60 family)
MLVEKKAHGLDSVIVAINSDEVLRELRARTMTSGKGRKRITRAAAAPGPVRKIVTARDHTVLLWESAASIEPVLLPVVRVGTDTAATSHERRRLAETAVSVALGAIKDGVVPGGGIALLNAHFRLLDWLDQPEAQRPEWLQVPDGRLDGRRIVTQALAAPALQLWQNARLDTKATLTKLHVGPPGEGVDLVQTAVGPMVGRGITDALVVVRTGLEEALSVTQHFAQLA